jgi:hypothetical protein
MNQEVVFKRMTNELTMVHKFERNLQDVKMLLIFAISLRFCASCLFEFPKCPTLQTHIPENSVLLGDQIEGRVKFDDLKITA